MERKQHNEQFKAQVRTEYQRGAFGYKKAATYRPCKRSCTSCILNKIPL
ncbi:hypothetical protein [Treponema phagedenis]|nr:hypothetical protein [Treponema phagedenis]NVP24629.1 hypothetical protein [Treponema phagedenis]QKS91910.1 hypothetical protein HPJ96_04590 [Treponema phagedenis]QLC58827.1 hypothetical protein HW453_08425 [Treponema phagedenis]